MSKKVFAQHPKTIREKHEEGFVVYHPGQHQRLIIFDECKVSLDGSLDETAGRRPLVTPTTTVVNESGTPTIKSADAVTLMLCAIGTEMVAPLVIFPSSAASKDNYKIPIKNIESFQQIRVQYGFPAARWHDAMFAISKKGSMNQAIFSDYINNHVLPLIPDLADVPGKRAAIKADVGPGRTCELCESIYVDSLNKTRSLSRGSIWSTTLLLTFLLYALLLLGIEFLSRTHIEDASFFPGMPNSTEVMQEMDQLFGHFKTALYNNQTALFEARMEGRGISASLSHADIGWLIFGGEVSLQSGATVTLSNTFTKYLSEKYLLKAYAKCGYYPATRSPLKSEKM